MAAPPPAFAGGERYMGIDIPARDEPIALTPQQREAAAHRAENAASGVLFDAGTSHGCAGAKLEDMSPQCRAFVLSVALAVAQARAKQYALPAELPMAERPLGWLARNAKSGDKAAQLELGKRFEAGQGIERDLDRARKLYRMAAAQSGGTMWIYSPPVGQSPGRVIPIDRGPIIPGLAEASERLKNLPKK